MLQSMYVGMFKCFKYVVYKYGCKFICKYVGYVCKYVLSMYIYKYGCKFICRLCM